VGRIRNQSAAARAQYAAAADDLASAQLDLAAEIAADYFTLRALDNEHGILVDTIATYRRSLELVKTGGSAAWSRIWMSRRRPRNCTRPRRSCRRLNCNGRSFRTRWRCCAASRR